MEAAFTFESTELLGQFMASFTCWHELWRNNTAIFAKNSSANLICHTIGQNKQANKQKIIKKIQFSAFQFSLHCDAVYYQVGNCKKRKGINLHLRMILQLLFLVFCYVQGIIKSSKTNCTSTANMCTWGTVTFLFKALLLQYIAEKCNNRICVVTSVASYPHLSKSSFFPQKLKKIIFEAKSGF